MAIDGPGILDSDLAHDVYNGILDQFDAGADIAAVREKLDSIGSELIDEIEEEIFVAAAAKAFWEIGSAQDDLIARFVALVEGDKVLVRWADVGAGPKFAKLRNSHLKRLLDKVSVPKGTPRRRKKYRPVAKKIFSAGDCLTLQIAGETYRSVVGKIDEKKGRCRYVLLVLEISTDISVESFAAGRYYGRRIPSQVSASGFEFGPDVVFLDHKILVREGNPFTVVGRIPVDENRFVPGSFGGVLSIADLKVEFTRVASNQFKTRELLPMSDLLAP